MDSLSLEETNAARVAMGLKPLAAADASVETEPTGDDLAERNYEELQAQLRADKEQAATKARIDRALNQRQLNAKRSGKGLADDDAAGDSAKSWAKGFKASAKKRAAELAAARRQQEQDEADAAAANVYDERSLKGLKVGHDVESFEEGGDTILTLRDSRIEADEDDELVNVNLAEYERMKERNDLLKKGKSGRQYTGYDDDETPGSTKGVLAKYDEDADRQAAKEAAGFRLGDNDLIEASTSAAIKQKQDPAKTVDRALLSLDYAKNLDVNDYLQEGEAGFKKPKKSKKKKAGQQRSALVEEDGDMPVDQPAGTSREDLEAQAMRDDEELQLSLARARREKGRQRRRERPTYEDDVQVKEEADDLVTEPGPSGGLVLDDTTEFIRNISSQSSLAHLEQKPRVSRPPVNGAVSPIPKPDVQDEESMEVDGPAGALLQPKIEDDDEYANGPPDADKMEQEQLVSSSLSATLTMLNQQGLLHKQTPEELERDRKSREHTAWIASRRADQREREDARLAAKAAGDSISQEQREAENRARDMEYNRRQMEAMANYKPDVEINYTDEFGRNMNQKEAWKALNHQFHGHGSGAAKTEARLRKIAEERKKEAMASGDTPLNLSGAFNARAERTGSATMVLSVGNRGSAPMIEGDLAPSLHANPAGASVSKGKGKGRAEVNLTPMLAGFTPTQIHHERSTGSTMMVPIPMADTPSPGASPAPRQSAGFARVSNKAVEAASRREESPAAPVAAPIKISIGKRKAEGEGEGSPASKKRG